MKTKVTIEFKFGAICNKTMDVTVCTNTQSIDVVPDNNLIGTCTLDVSLPAQITIKLSGKTNEKDTIVDENGNMIEDKFVQITKFALDCFELNEIFLHQRIKLLTKDNNEYTTSYFGFNGKVTLNLNKNNVLEQFLECQREF